MDHLVGIGGMGMSALAQALVARGHAVRGADRTLGTDAIRRLESGGISVYPNDGSGVTDAVTRVIVSTAIEPDNPDLAAARARGLPIVHRAEALADCLADRKLVAVAGTCGKSSVTALLGHALAVCGFDPFVVNGAPVVGWNGSVRAGKGAYAVAEVDESDKSLTAFRPYAVVVTNASADHYSKEEMDTVFDAFARGVPGPVVDARRETYAPEDFMEQNKAVALRMAVALGADRGKALEALATFPGVERRLQRIGTLDGREGGAVVYDDYAHNTEKLRALLATLQKRHERGVALLWRPHGYAPLRKMKDALAAMFRETLRAQDSLFLLPVYDAGGTADRSVNSDALGMGVLVESLELAEKVLRGRASAFDAIVTAGARDPGLALLARRLAGKE